MDSKIAKPAKKNYKGDIVALKDIKNFPVCVERVGNKRISNNYGSYELPHFMTLIGHKSYYYETRNVGLMPYKTGGLQKVLVSETTQFKVLTGLQGIAVKEDFNKLITNSLGDLCREPLARTFGADPEFFVENGKGELIPAFLFLKAPNDACVNMSGWNQKIYWDGFQAEFNLIPGGCMEYGTDYLHDAMYYLLNLARRFDKTARLSAKTLFHVPLEMLAKTDQKYVMFGCKPSLNVYGLKADLDRPASEITARSAGGHIHFGFGTIDKENVIKVVRALDAVVGVGCVSLFAGYDDPTRRRYYGLPGEYRLPAHGLEYRTLSNAWLFHPFISNLVIDLARVVTNFGYNGYCESLWKATERETVETILSCNVDKAREILDRNKGIMEQLFRACYGNAPDSISACIDVMIKGVDSAISDYKNIEANWILDSAKSVRESNSLGKSVYNGAKLLKKGTKL